MFRFRAFGVLVLFFSHGAGTAQATSWRGGPYPLRSSEPPEALRLEEAGTDWGLSGGLQLGSWLAPVAGAVSLGIALIVAASAL